MSPEQDTSPTEPMNVPSMGDDWAQAMVDALNEYLKEKDDRNDYQRELVDYGQQSSGTSARIKTNDAVPPVSISR